MIRSLSRGLDILTILNKRGSASASEISDALRMPRSTVYRILETLVNKGFIYQHKSDKRFRLTDKIETLSDGYTEDDHMANISRDYLERFTKKFQWPATLATLSGLSIVVRENTDLESPYAVEQFTIGYTMPILGTASGFCILAFMNNDKRQSLIDTLLSSEDGNKEDYDQMSLEREFKTVKTNGYAVKIRTRRFTDQTAISVPIKNSKSIIKGALTVRYSTSAYELNDAIKLFVPSLEEASGEISTKIDAYKNKQKTALDSAYEL